MNRSFNEKAKNKNAQNKNKEENNRETNIRQNIQNEIKRKAFVGRVLYLQGTSWHHLEFKKLMSLTEFSWIQNNDRMWKKKES